MSTPKNKLSSCEENKPIVDKINGSENTD